MKNLQLPEQTKSNSYEERLKTVASEQATFNEIYSYNKQQIYRLHGIDADPVGEGTFQQTRVHRERTMKSTIKDQMQIMNTLYSSNDHISYSILTYGNDGIVKNHYGFKTSFEMMSEFIANMDIGWDIEGNMVNATVSTHV